MGSLRKLQAEIDRTLKLVSSGLGVFDDYLEQFRSAETPGLRDKYEAQLKSEVKKLQKYRDSIKTWLAEGAVKDQSRLSGAKRDVEKRMEAYRACEREQRTKAYSTATLQAGGKVDPREKARGEAREGLRRRTDALAERVEELEAELEELEASGAGGGGGKKGKKGAKGGGGAVGGAGKNGKEGGQAGGAAGSTGASPAPFPPQSERAERIRAHLGRHAAHAARLEQVVRLLDNGGLEAADVEGIDEFLDDYLECCDEDPDAYADPDDAYASVLDQLEGLQATAAGVPGSGVGVLPGHTPHREALKADVVKGTALKANAAKADAGRTEGHAVAKPDAGVPAGAPPSSAAAVAPPAGAQAPPVPADVTVLPPSAASASPARGAGAADAPAASLPGASGRDGERGAGAQVSPALAGAPPPSSPSGPGGAAAAPPRPEAPVAANGSGAWGGAGVPPASDGAGPSPSPAPATTAGAGPVGDGQGEGAGTAGSSPSPGPPGPPAQPPRTLTPESLAALAEALRPLDVEGEGPAKAPAAAAGAAPAAAGAAAAGARPAPTAVGEMVRLLAASAQRSLPLVSDGRWQARRTPTHPARSRPPPSWPTSPVPTLASPALYPRLDPEALLLAFHLLPGSRPQAHAAAELTRQGWRYHPGLCAWIRRRGEPRGALDGGECGDYVYFDSGAAGAAGGKGAAEAPPDAKTDARGTPLLATDEAGDAALAGSEAGRADDGWCYRLKGDFELRYADLEDFLA